jgi:plasmid stabilization system protein ParE
MIWAVEFHPEARAEALESEAWHSERDPSVAVAFAAELERAVEAIAETPLAWPPHRSGTRRRLLRKFPYAVVYRTLTDRVQVVAVAHQRRRPGYWRDR